MVFLAGAIVILIVSMFRRNPAKRFEDFVTVIGYVVYVAIGGALHGWIVKATPRTFDVTLSRFDAILHFSTNATATALAHHGWAMVVLILTYVSLSLVIGIAWSLEQDVVMRRAVSLAGCFCFVCYAAFPAVGPVHFNMAIGLAEFAPRNAFPSLHVTWAMLLAINARDLRLRMGLWLYAGLTAMSTIALREHYLVDLIAALPYTFAMQWMAVHLQMKSFRFIGANPPTPSYDSLTVENL